MEFFKTIITALFLISCNSIDASEVEQFVKTKNGITLFALNGKGSIEGRKMYTAFLEKLVESIKRPDENIPIFILSDQFSFFPLRRKDWFATIAYDTLRGPDLSFIENYFYYRMGENYRKEIFKFSTPISNKHQIDLPEPIDLGSTYDGKEPVLGLKIFYEYGENDSLTGWDRIYTLVQYAIDHLDQIKMNQKRIVFRYHAVTSEETEYVPRISLLTIDTFQIKNIPLQSSGFNPSEDANNDLKYILISALMLLVLALVIKGRKSNVVKTKGCP